MEWPATNGVDWTSGALLLAPNIANIVEDPREIQARGRVGALKGAIDGVDANKLEDAGWGVLFGPNTPDRIKCDLDVLLKKRKDDAGPRFRVFEGSQAYRSGDTARLWLRRQNVGFAMVDPARGVPLYLLIVASPQDIPFEFQYMLDTYWSVGRLWFDETFENGFREYAERLVAYERGHKVPCAKRVTVFATSHPADKATAFFHNQVARPFVEGGNGHSPLGQKQGFTLESVLRLDANKTHLSEILAGQSPGGRPSLLFSGSHGMYANELVVERLEKIGGIVTNEWDGGSPLSTSCTFTAEDLSHVSTVDGLVHFFFACYSAGCPSLDMYTSFPSGSRKRLLDATIVSRLPQAMLAKGALGVIGHVDRVFACSFQTDRWQPQTQDIRGVLDRIMQGDRLGQALDNFNVRWVVLSAELSDLLRDRNDNPTSVKDEEVANYWLVRDDARNYVLLGDPAARLRTELMSG